MSVTISAAAPTRTAAMARSSQVSLGRAPLPAAWNRAHTFHKLGLPGPPRGVFIPLFLLDSRLLFCFNADSVRNAQVRNCWCVIRRVHTREDNATFPAGCATVKMKFLRNKRVRAKRHTRRRPKFRPRPTGRPTETASE